MIHSEEDTEWTDILRAKGIMAPKEVPKEITPPPSPTQEEKLDGLTLDEITAELDALVDSKQTNDEEDFLVKYREKRLNEMKDLADRSKYGTVLEVTKADWKAEINNVRGITIIVHIYMKGNEVSDITDKYLRQLAYQEKTIKFLRGEAVTCLGESGSKFPTTSLPTFLVYRDDQMIGQACGLRDLMITKAEQITATVLGNCFRRMGALDGNTNVDADNDNEEKPRSNRICIRSEENGKAGGIKAGRNIISRGGGNKHDDVSDSDENDW